MISQTSQTVKIEDIQARVTFNEVTPGYIGIEYIGSCPVLTKPFRYGIDDDEDYYDEDELEECNSPLTVFEFSKGGIKASCRMGHETSEILATIKTMPVIHRIERVEEKVALPSSNITQPSELSKRLEKKAKGQQSYEPLTQFTKFSEIEEKELHWLWQGYIPLGKITGIDGMPDQSKSVVSVDLTAKVTTGKTMPDGTEGVNGGVVLIAIEDDANDTIKPRLKAANADMSRVIDLSKVWKMNTETQEITEHVFTLPDDLPILEKAIEEVEAKLVIVDPLFAVLNPRLQSKNDQDTRQALTPLKAIAEKTQTAILVIRHFNKTGSNDPLKRGAGNMGIQGAYRSTMTIFPMLDNEDNHVLALIKHNLTNRSIPNLRYTIESNSNGRPVMKWLGVKERSARELMSGSEEGKLSSGKQEILHTLRTFNKPVTTKEICEALPEMKPTTVRSLLSRMWMGHEISKTARGEYGLNGEHDYSGKLGNVATKK